MGEVYRAHDTKLKRDVAIKVLPAAFTEDKERLARFEREAQILAQLQHPNIASIYGLEDSAGVRALVMELVEGPTLAERLEQGPLPFNESLSISLQIAQALEEAHEKGIVHRDLKPQNVKASIEGRVKVLDFGLAKAMDPSAGSAASAVDMARSPTMMQSPTLTAAHGTQLGVILGTAAYMSPEQAKGMAVDKRADIWAFGVVLYEMLSGRSLFAGDSVPDTLARVLQREVDFSALPASVPLSIRSLLRRCLERNPKNRLRDIGDARLVLEEALAAPGESAVGAAAAPPIRAWARVLPWAIAAAAVAIAGWTVARGVGGEAGNRSGAAEVIRLEISPPPSVEPIAGIAGGFAISPDGRTMAIIGVREGQRGLYLRRLDQAEWVEVTGSMGVNSPVFSPDSARVAFVPGSAEVVLWSLADRQRAVVATGADLGSTVAWGPSGIYFLRNGEIWSAPAAGGEATRLTELDATRHEAVHSDAVELPGSRRVLFSSLTTETATTRIESVAIDGGQRSVVIERASTPVWSESGHLLFAREGVILAVAYDPVRNVVSGQAVPALRAGTVGSLRFGSLAYRLSSTGTLVYMPPDYGEKRVMSVPRRGGEQPLEMPPGAYANPRLSPDGRRLLLERGSSLLEVLDLERGTRTQLTAPAFGTSFPTWSGDGERVVFRRFNLPHWVAADGSGRSGLVPLGSVNDYPTAPGPDPDSFLTVRIRSETSADIFLSSISGAFEPKPLLATPAFEGGPQLSPDGKWLVYQSSASGQPEAYLRRFPELERAWQVSEGGGVQTRWSADGREIFYRSGGRIMSSTFDGRGVEPILGRPVVLFTDEYDFGGGLSISNYDVTRDGHFLMLRRTSAGGRLHVVLNWGGELKRLIASGGVR